MVGGRYQQAADELTELLVRDPDRATAHWLLGKIELFKSNPQAAMRRYETAFAIAPFHREVLQGLVDAAERLEDKDKLKAYQAALEIFDANNG